MDEKSERMTRRAIPRCYVSVLDQVWTEDRGMRVCGESHPGQSSRGFLHLLNESK